MDSPESLFELDVGSKGVTCCCCCCLAGLGGEQQSPRLDLPRTHAWAGLHYRTHCTDGRMETNMLYSDLQSPGIALEVQLVVPEPCDCPLFITEIPLYTPAGEGGDSSKVGKVCEGGEEVKEVNQWGEKVTQTFHQKDTS